MEKIPGNTLKLFDLQKDERVKLPILPIVKCNHGYTLRFARKGGGKVFGRKLGNPRMR
jgi:hypothetical protein